MGIKARLRSAARELLGSPSPAQDPGTEELDAVRYAIGEMAARSARYAATPGGAEFKCFSQNGEDGILQWLLARVSIGEPTFVEFGVGDYRESNTRFLLQHDNWRGWILDRGSAHLQTVGHGDLAWKYAIEARTAHITRENAATVLADVPSDLGLLSIDIDGNDYWVLTALERLRPRIVVVEYNSVLGFERAVAVPYDPQFDRAAAHYTWIYSGASIAAFCYWAHQHDYSLVASNSVGNNAFFVRNDARGSVAPLTPSEGWVKSRFGRPRDVEGRLTHIDDHGERRALIADMPLIDVETGMSLRVRDLTR